MKQSFLTRPRAFSSCLKLDVCTTATIHSVRNTGVTLHIYMNIYLCFRQLHELGVLRMYTNPVL